MDEAVQGGVCRQCGEPKLLWDFVVIADTPETGRMHSATCIQCIKELNNLRSGKK